MRKTSFVVVLSVLVILLSFPVLAGEKGECETIQSGNLKASDGLVIIPGFDVWGYNYQAHIFNGWYCDAYRNADWCQEYSDTWLNMKWNDAWLSNKDCDGDGKLDRHSGYDSYIGSGAWTTNHMGGEYVGDEGKLCHFEYFVKIVAVPASAELRNGVWYDGATGDVIGETIWGQFAVIQEIENDACQGVHGRKLLGDRPGLGGWAD